MEIGLFAPPVRETRSLLSALEAARPGCVRFFDLTRLDEARLHLSEDSLSWDGVDLTTLRHAFLHGFTYQNPIVPETSLLTEWAVWQAGYLADQQKFSFLLSLFTEMDRRGVRLVNPPRAHLKNFAKFTWLGELRQAGFSVAPLIQTNDSRLASAFTRENQAVVWRPGTGRAAWQLFQEKQRLALLDPGKPPVMLAGVVEGLLARAYLLEGRLILALSHQAPLFRPPLETMERFFHLDPPPEAVATLEALAKSVALPWLQVTFVLEGNRPWIYDLDPDPLFDWLPPAHGEFLRASLAAHLTGGAPPAVAAELRDPLERPNMFLRRMYKILFEFEESKYR